MAISSAKKHIRLRQRLVGLARQRHFPLPQSSSASRVTAGAFGFVIFNQSGERPER
jgi:hypothetical protein